MCTCICIRCLFQRLFAVCSVVVFAFLLCVCVYTSIAYGGGSRVEGGGKREEERGRREAGRARVRKG